MVRRVGLPVVLRCRQPHGDRGGSMSSANRHPHRGQHGQTLLEFALVAPLMLVFLLGLVGFGIAIDRRPVLDHAAREGHALCVCRG